MRNPNKTQDLAFKSSKNDNIQYKIGEWDLPFFCCRKDQQSDDGVVLSYALVVNQCVGKNMEELFTITLSKVILRCEVK